MKSKKAVVVPFHYQGERLDRVLELLMPGLGLRSRKRIWEGFRVEVDGQARGKGFRVSQGQEVALTARQEQKSLGSVLEEWPGLRLVNEQGGYAALYKPAGLHTVSLENRFSPSLEQGLQELFPEDTPRLLNRLDRLTTGLVLAARGPEAVQSYLELQGMGRVLKYYLAICRGRLTGEQKVRQKILASGRKKVRVLEEEDPDPLRDTRLTPLSYDPSQDRTLVQALICKGARHQIRAHLAWQGFPLVGDPVYGLENGQSLSLHHYRIDFPGFLAEVEPEWTFF